MRLIFTYLYRHIFHSILCLILCCCSNLKGPIQNDLLSRNLKGSMPNLRLSNKMKAPLSKNPISGILKYQIKNKGLNSIIGRTQTLTRDVTKGTVLAKVEKVVRKIFAGQENPLDEPIIPYRPMSYRIPSVRPSDTILLRI